MDGTSGITDELVQQAVSGSHPHVARLLEVLQPRIRSMVRARLSPQPRQLDLVYDIMQEVSRALFEGLGGLRNRTAEGLRAFLSGIVTRQVALFIRKWRRHRQVPCSYHFFDSSGSARGSTGARLRLLTSGRTSPLSAADRAERCALVLRELGTLPAHHRKVLTLALIDQLPLREIGLRMGLSRNAVAMRLLRAQRELGLRLAEIAPVESVVGSRA